MDSGRRGWAPRGGMQLARRRFASRQGRPPSANKSEHSAQGRDIYHTKSPAQCGRGCQPAQAGEAVSATPDGPRLQRKSCGGVSATPGISDGLATSSSTQPRGPSNQSQPPIHPPPHKPQACRLLCPREACAPCWVSQASSKREEKEKGGRRLEEREPRAAMSGGKTAVENSGGAGGVWQNPHRLSMKKDPPRPSSLHVLFIVTPRRKDVLICSRSSGSRSWSIQSEGGGKARSGRRMGRTSRGPRQREVIRERHACHSGIRPIL